MFGLSVKKTPTFSFNCLFFILFTAEQPETAQTAPLTCSNNPQMSITREGLVPAWIDVWFYKEHLNTSLPEADPGPRNSHSLDWTMDQLWSGPGVFWEQVYLRRFGFVTHHTELFLLDLYLVSNDHDVK